MKIPIRYGLLTALGLMIWIVVAHLLITNPRSAVHTLGGPVFFNLLHFVMIFLGLKRLERKKGDRRRFKEALKTGVGISFVYALTASLFFVFVLLFVGTRWLATEPGFESRPKTVVVAQAFAGLFLGVMILGLVYSTVISFFLAKRRSEE